MDGLDRIGALAAKIDNFDNLGKTWSNYGYIVTKPSKLDNRTITYTVWTTNGNVEVQEERSSITGREKGTVIGFDTLNEKDGVNVIDDVEALDASTSNTTTDDITFTAITDANKKTVQFAVKPVGGSGTELDVAGTILYIDSNADNDLDIGVEDGEIKEAQKIDGDYLANALVIGNAGDIELLIVDQGEYLKNDVYKAVVETNSGKVIYGGDASAQSISDETFADAAVGTAYDVQKTLTAKNIADKKSAYVEITDGDDLGLNVKVSDVDDEKITVTVSGTPTKTGTLKFTVSADDATSDVMQVEVKDAASDINIAVGTPSGTLTYDAAGSFTIDVTAMNAFGETLEVKSIIKENTTADVKDKFNISGLSMFMSPSPSTPQSMKVEYDTGDKADAGKYTVTIGVEGKDNVTTKSFTFDVVNAKISSLTIDNTVVAPTAASAGTPPVLSGLPTGVTANEVAAWAGGSGVDGAAQIGDTYTLTAGDNYEFDTTAITTSSSVTGGTLNGGTITIDSVTAEEIEITLTYSTIS